MSDQSCTYFTFLARFMCALSLLSCFVNNCIASVIFLTYFILYIVFY